MNVLLFYVLLLIHFFKRYEGEDVFSVDVVFIYVLLLQNSCGP